MSKRMDKVHRQVQKHWHTVCRELGMSQADKEAVLMPYGVRSSSDMETHDLLDVVAALDKELAARKSKGFADLDKLRKRAMAAIGAWPKHQGKESGVAYIKTIACRSTGYKDYNRIPPERLRNLIGLYNNKVKDALGASRVKREIVEPASTWVCVEPVGEA